MTPREPVGWVVVWHRDDIGRWLVSGMVWHRDDIGRWLVSGRLFDDEATAHEFCEESGWNAHRDGDGNDAYTVEPVGVPHEERGERGLAGAFYAGWFARDTHKPDSTGGGTPANHQAFAHWLRTVADKEEGASHE